MRFVTPDITPPGSPLIEPGEAVAIALTTSKIGKSYSPESLPVRLVLQALQRSGWKLVPHELSVPHRVIETQTESAHERTEHRR